jgi:cell division protein FtsL
MNVHSRDLHQKEQRLEAIDARLARHEKVIRITLVIVVILAGLALALLAQQLFDLSTASNK